ncbi:hypothetical protein Plhal703r1_c68g0170301 [Plasmopara halstedii]
MHVRAKIRWKFIQNENFDLVAPTILELSRPDKHRCYQPLLAILKLQYNPGE